MQHETDPIDYLAEEPTSAPHQHPRKRRFSGRLLGATVGAVVLSLIVGLVGGVTGFVALSSDSSLARTVRKTLNISADNPLPISTTSKITLEESSNVSDAAAKVTPAVVSISASQTVENFFGQSSTQEVSGGTGFIISSDGLIVTNKHVVADTTLSYKVVLDDGRIFDAKVQARDPLNDLALVKIDAKDLPTVEIGSSNDLKVGQYVLAIGNALGEFQNSVSLGIVSAKNRSIDAGEGNGGSSERLTGLIQTDAAINPGNSGGPLINLAGQVVGIDTAIATNGSSASGSIGLGFALGIDSVSAVIANARRTGEIVRPYIGVRYTQIDKSVQQHNNLSVDYGAFISLSTDPNSPSIVPNSPAAKAGLQPGDIILDVNGEQINTDNPLIDRLQKYNPGDTVKLTILRGGKQTDVNVTLEKAS
jgi:serine protease Do